MGAGGIIIIRNLKAAAQVSVTPSGSVKAWHLLVATHALAFVAGLLV